MLAMVDTKGKKEEGDGRARGSCTSSHFENLRKIVR
jgi:hypothetical protein